MNSLNQAYRGNRDINPIILLYHDIKNYIVASLTYRLANFGENIQDLYFVLQNCITRTSTIHNVNISIVYKFV